MLYGLGNHIGDISVDNGVKASLYNWTAGETVTVPRANSALLTMAPEMIIIIDIGIAKIVRARS